MRRVLLSVSLIASIAPEARAEPIRVAVATIGLKPDGPNAEALRSRVRSALAERTGLTSIDETIERRLFASVEPERPTHTLKSAQRALRKAQRALRNFELDQAQAGYAKATELLAPVLGLEESVELDKERLALGVALAYALRNDEHITERILEYATRYGAEGPPTWPPELIERLKSATPASDTKLSVTTVPPGADVRLDGAKVGVTPLELDVRPGSHRVEVTESGYFAADAWVTTSNLGPQEAKFLLTSDISAALRRQPAAKPLGPALASRVLELGAEAGAVVVVVAGLNQGRINLRSVGASGEDAQRYEADDSDEGVRLALSQMFDTGAGSPHGISGWAWVGAGAGAAAIAGGVALRVLAVGAQKDLMSREGALTQREAFD